VSDRPHDNKDDHPEPAGLPATDRHPCVGRLYRVSNLEFYTVRTIGPGTRSQ